MENFGRLSFKNFKENQLNIRISVLFEFGSKSAPIPRRINFTHCLHPAGCLPGFLVWLQCGCAFVRAAAAALAFMCVCAIRQVQKWEIGKVGEDLRSRPKKKPTEPSGGYGPN